LEQPFTQGSIGPPYPDADIKIMDKETGTKELPPPPFAVADTGGLTREQAEERDACERARKSQKIAFR
jgi:hypothetical protein